MKEGIVKLIRSVTGEIKIVKAKKTEIESLKLHNCIILSLERGKNKYLDFCQLYLIWKKIPQIDFVLTRRKTNKTERTE